MAYVVGHGGSGYSSGGSHGSLGYSVGSLGAHQSYGGHGSSDTSAVTFGSKTYNSLENNHNSNDFSYLMIMTPRIFSGHGSSHHGGDHNDLDLGTFVSAVGSGDHHGHGHQGLDTATIVAAALGSDSGSHHGSSHSSYGGLNSATIVGATQGGKYWGGVVYEP